MTRMTIAALPIVELIDGASSEHELKIWEFLDRILLTHGNNITSDGVTK